MIVEDDNRVYSQFLLLCEVERGVETGLSSVIVARLRRSKEISGLA